MMETESKTKRKPAAPKQVRSKILTNNLLHSSQQQFHLARLAVKPARKIYDKKRECNFWELKMVDGLTRLIEEHYKTDTKVSFYCGHFKVSARTLNRLASFCLGQTVYQLIMDRRLSESREMLQEGSKIIKEIAYELGFKSSTRFSRFFKESTGMSAREYKRASVRHLLTIKKECMPMDK